MKSRGDRRRTSRRAVGERISWQDPHGRHERAGIVIERSLDGFAFLANAREAPSTGERIVPRIRRRGGDDVGIDAAVVRRTEALGQGICLIAAEIEA